MIGGEDRIDLRGEGALRNVSMSKRWRSGANGCKFFSASRNRRTAGYIRRPSFGWLGRANCFCKWTKPPAA